MRPVTTLGTERRSIGELSKLAGVNIETIRYYEKIKMLPAPPRTESGRRVYGTAERRRLSFIRRARELGFTLDEIRALLDLDGPGKQASCAEVRDIAAHHLADIRAKIADLRKLERVLAATIERCSGDAVPECPVLDMLDAGRIGSPAPAQKGAKRHGG